MAYGDEKKEKFDYKDKKDYVPYQNALLKKSEPDTWYDECFDGILIESLEQLEELCNVKGIKVAVDTETTGLTFNKDKIVGISFSFNSKSGYYLPLRHQYGNLPLKEALVHIKRLLYNNTIIMFNVIFDSMMLEAEGIDMSGVDLFEVQSLIFCADSNVKGRNLKWASEWYLGRKSPTFKQTLGTSTEHFHFGYLMPNESVLYTASDSANTFGLYDLLYTGLMKECGFTIKLDNALVKAMLNYYIKQPIYIDSEKMTVLSEYLRNRILELERKIFIKLGTTVDLECVSYDGKVITESHGTITMKELKELMLKQNSQPINVLTPTGYQEALSFIDVGNKPLVQIELENGEVLECSPDHYLLVENFLTKDIYFKQVSNIDLDTEELVDDTLRLTSEDMNDYLCELVLSKLDFTLPSLMSV